MRRLRCTALSLAASALLIAAALAPTPSTAQSQTQQRPNQLPPPGGQGQPQRQQLAPPGGAQKQRQQLPPPGGGQAQQQRQQLQPPGGQAQQRPPQQQAAAPVPYQAVTVSEPKPLGDPSFDAFRQQVEDAAKRKDRAALGRLIVAQGFFWEGEKGDKANKKRSSIDNLTSALQLGNKDGSGWEALQGFATDPTAMPMQGRNGVVCGPADPVFDGKALEEVIKTTKTGEQDWGYTAQPNVEVRGAAQANAPVIEKLGSQFVWVVPEEPAANDQNPMLKIVTPSGKTGFVPAEAISPLGSDQLCYVKDASGWKIAGFVGGDQ